VADFIFEKIICVFGPPKTLISDNGLEFVGKEVSYLCEKYGIQQKFISPHHPPANGLCENQGKLLLERLRKKLLENPESRWAQLIMYVCYQLNITPGKKRPSPYYLLFGITPKVLYEFLKEPEDFDRMEELENLKEERENYRTAWNKKRKTLLKDALRKDSLDIYEIGDVVALWRPKRYKLDTQYKDLYAIDEILYGGSYSLKNLKTGHKRVENQANLKRINL